MQKNRVHILCTGPVSETLVREAGQNDIIIHEGCFIKTVEIKSAAIEQRINELAHQKITAVFTSMRAVEAVEKFIPGTKTSWKIFCTGNTTKKMVNKIFGEQNICAVADNAEQLAEKIVENSFIKNVVFFCGDQRRNELPVKLKNNGITVEELVVYKTVGTPQILVKQYDGILFFSPSAVKSFFSKNSITAKTQVFAIGTTTANSAKSFTQQPVIISNKPGKENLVTLAIEHFSKSKSIRCNP
jgi:uroporphyrinogen-III synthase